jgi:hypothetical protein
MSKGFSRWALDQRHDSKEMTMADMFELYELEPETHEHFPVVVESDGSIHSNDGGSPTLLTEEGLVKALLTLLEESALLTVHIARISSELLEYRRQRAIARGTP